MNNCLITSYLSFSTDSSEDICVWYIYIQRNTDETDLIFAVRLSVLLLTFHHQQNLIYWSALLTPYNIFRVVTDVVFGFPKTVLSIK